MSSLISAVAAHVLSVLPRDDTLTLNPLPSRGAEVALNPQPLPPVDDVLARSRGGDEVALNPQPLPPRWSIAIHAALLDAVALNPQPLPPRFGTTLIDDCGTPHGRVPLPHPGPRGDVGQG